MKYTLNVENWERKEHFNFFRQFDEPFFGVTVTINCTVAYRKAKEEGMSFFLLYLHKALAAANTVENFRYRISGNQVTAYDRVDAGPTIMRPNNTFGFGYIYFNEDFSTFTQGAREEIRRVKESTSLMPAVSGENIIHFSTVQWLDFTSMSHARNFSFNDSCPKISFGKMTENDGVLSMPVSVHVHHALADGYHVGQFIELFQNLMDEQ